MNRRTHIVLAVLSAVTLAPAHWTRAAEFPQYFAGASLRVEIQPPAAAGSVEWQLASERDASGSWVAPGESWLASGAEAIELAPGRYGIVFRAGGGWAAPEPKEIELAPAAELVETVAAESLPVYPIGEIPDHSVRVGETLAFVVTGATGVRYDPHPELMRELDVSDGVFSYRPAPAERRPFEVVIEGTSGEQSFRVTPAGASEAEVAVLRYEGAVPDAEAATYLHVSWDERAVAPPLNHAHSTARDVTISGPRVVFEPGHPNGLYDGVTAFNDDEDIASLTIYADEVVIRGAELRLPQTDVTIWAREFRFEDTGEGVASLNTTPVAKSGTATNGARGLDGSTITLHIGALAAEGNARRFVAQGGRGQDGTPGRDGTALSPAPRSFTTYSSNVRTTFLGNTRTAPGFPGGWSGRVIRRVVKERCAVTITRQDDGTSACPRSGNAAVANGTSGNGGNGGRVIAPFGLGALVDVRAGAAGPSYPERRGSPGDTPYNAIHAEISFNCVGEFGSWSSTNSCGNTAGANRSATSAPGPAPAAGSVATSISPPAWVHPLSVRAVLELTRDVYLSGYYDRARELLRPYEAALAILSDEAMGPQLLQVKREVATLLHRLDSQLDYFGKPAGWVPILSFEVLFGLYESEVESAGDVLYLTHYLTRRTEDVINVAAAVVRLRNELEEEIDEFTSELEGVKVEIRDLEDTARIIEQRIAESQANLENRREQLREKAQYTAGLKKAFRVAGAVLPLIPVAQPALAIAGTALTTASKFNEEPPESLAAEFLKSAIPIGVEGFLSEKEEPETDEEKKAAELQKRAQFVQAGITGVVAVAKEAQSWESDVEAELDRLVAADPQSRGIAREIRALNKRKLDFAVKLATAVQDASRLMDGISQNYLARESLNRDVVSVNEKIDEQAFGFIREIERRAKDRLLFYQYLMAKAYEYRMLTTDHNVNFQLDRLFEFFQNLTDPEVSADPSESIISHLEFDGADLIGVYTEELSAVTQQVVLRFLDRGLERSSTVFYTLNEQQIEELRAAGEVAINLRETPIFDDEGQLLRFGIFGADKENLRLRGISIEERDITIDRSAGVSPNDVIEIFIEHPGESLIEFEGEVYRFDHRQTAERNDIFWGATYFPSRDQVRLDSPAAAENSLIGVLLIDRSTDDVLTYSRPGAWTDLKVRISSTNADLEIQALTLTVEYDYVPKRNGQADLEVRALSESLDSLSPRIVVGSPDSNGRSDGKGSFRRSYRTSQSVVLEAPEIYGGLVFDRWMEGKNVRAESQALTLDLESGASPTLTQVRAVYRMSDEEPPPPGEVRFRRGDANNDGARDLGDVIAVLDLLFADGDALACLKAADANDDGLIDVSDAVRLLTTLFLGSTTIPAPDGDCGEDPTGDDLSCESSTCR